MLSVQTEAEDLREPASDDHLGDDIVAVASRSRMNEGAARIMNFSGLRNPGADLLSGLNYRTAFNTLPINWSRGLAACVVSVACGTSTHYR